jgi:hypothetical protein
MGALDLYGIKVTFGVIKATAVKRQHETRRCGSSI